MIIIQKTYRAFFTVPCGTVIYLNIWIIFPCLVFFCFHFVIGDSITYKPVNRLSRYKCLYTRDTLTELRWPPVQSLWDFYLSINQICALHHKQNTLSAFKMMHFVKCHRYTSLHVRLFQIWGTQKLKAASPHLVPGMQSRTRTNSSTTWLDLCWIRSATLKGLKIHTITYFMLHVI